MQQKTVALKDQKDKKRKGLYYKIRQDFTSFPIVIPFSSSWPKDKVKSLNYLKITEETRKNPFVLICLLDGIISSNNQETKILFLEDQKEIAKPIMKYILEKYKNNIEIVYYPNPVLYLESLAYCSKPRNFNVIICDHQMPEMQGCEFLNLLNKILSQKPY